MVPRGYGCGFRGRTWATASCAALKPVAGFIYARLSRIGCATEPVEGAIFLDFRHGLLTN